MTDWNARFMDLAKEVASWSKDRSRKVGCVIVGPNREIRRKAVRNGITRIRDQVNETSKKALQRCGSLRRSVRSNWFWSGD